MSIEHADQKTLGRATVYLCRTKFHLDFTRFDSVESGYLTSTLSQEGETPRAFDLVPQSWSLSLFRFSSRRFLTVLVSYGHSGVHDFSFIENHFSNCYLPANLALLYKI